MKILLIVIILINFGCAHNEAVNIFERRLSDDKCEEALDSIPLMYENVKVWDKTKKVAGTAASYAATGAGYTADVLVTVGQGLLVLAAFGVACAPAILLNGTHCLPMNFNFKKLEYSSYGKKMSSNTKPWRCPNLSNMAESVQKVSACYERRETKQNYDKALLNLKELKSRELFWNCLNKDGRRDINNQIERLEKKQQL